jgi:hypothetical protein
MPADTPIQYLAEFPGIESKPVPQYSPAAKPQLNSERTAEVGTISPTIQPTAQVESVQLARPIGAPKEICTFCDGLPKEVVPPHDCRSYMAPVGTVDRAAARSRRTVTPNTSQDEKIKQRIRKLGYGDAIQGSQVLFDNVLISFREWERQNPEQPN